MATTLTPEQLNSLARLGAQQRIAELEAEIAAIRANFAPARRGPGRPRKNAAPVASFESAPAPKRRRRRRRQMSPAERKAVSERMTRYWAERRRAKGR